MVALPVPLLRTVNAAVTTLTTAQKPAENSLLLENGVAALQGWGGIARERSCSFRVLVSGPGPGRVQVLCGGREETWGGSLVH